MDNKLPEEAAFQPLGVASGWDEPDIVEGLTTAFIEASPLEKWELLALNGLLGTDEPWIENMRDALKAQETTNAQLRADNARLVEALRKAVGGLACRSDCEWLHPEGYKCDCGNSERKLAAQATLQETGNG